MNDTSFKNITKEYIKIVNDLKNDKLLSFEKYLPFHKDWIILDKLSTEIISNLEEITDTTKKEKMLKIALNSIFLLGVNIENFKTK